MQLEGSPIVVAQNEKFHGKEFAFDFCYLRNMECLYWRRI